MLFCIEKKHVLSFYVISCDRRLFIMLSGRTLQQLSFLNEESQADGIVRRSFCSIGCTYMHVHGAEKPTVSPVGSIVIFTVVRNCLDRSSGSRRHNASLIRFRVPSLCQIGLNAAVKYLLRIRQVARVSLSTLHTANRMKIEKEDK